MFTHAHGYTAKYEADLLKLDEGKLKYTFWWKK